ncbi:flavodoxin family protein [Mycoplasmatota bacterium zrk1]
MKVIVINGSPKTNGGNTQIIVNSFTEGLKKGNAEVKEYHLSNKDVNHCTGCFDCWTKHPGTCRFKDDMPKMIYDLLDSDYCILSTPVYGALMTGYLKNFLDRLLPLASPYISKNEDGTFYHEGRVCKYPRFIIISTAGFPGDRNFDFIKAYFDNLKPVFEIYRNSAGVLDATRSDGEELYNTIEEFKRSVKEAGYEFALNTKIQQSTIDSINRRLLSDDEYMKIVNNYWDENVKEAS